MTRDGAELEARRDLAAVFRICDRLGMNEHIGNHNSYLFDEVKGRFLINARGLHFQEVTASNLLVCDLDGRVVSGDGEVRGVARHIHGPIHRRVPQARCILHLHPKYLTALSLIEDGRLQPSHQNMALLHNRVAYDDIHNGVVTDDEEGGRIAQALGERTILVMRNHGVTVVGPTIQDAFDELYTAERTCMYQLEAMATGRRLARLPDRLLTPFPGPWSTRVDAYHHFSAWRRQLDREGSNHAD